MDKVIGIKEIIRLGIVKYGTQDAFCNAANISKSTLWRLAEGKTLSMHDKTLGKLVRAIND